MSKSLKDTESLHKDQHVTTVIFLAVNSIDEAGQKKMIKLVITHMISQQREY